MIRWVVGAFLVGVAVGALAMSLVDGDALDRAPAERAPVATPPRAPDPAAPAPPIPRAPVAEPSAPAPDATDAGWGVLFVRAAAGEVRIYGTDLRGRPEMFETEEVTGTADAPFELRAGRYRVLWKDAGGMRRHAADAIVAAGRATRVDVGEARFAAEDPGLGVVTVLVPRAGGGGGRGDVYVEVAPADGGDAIWELTRADGRARFRLVPGRYAVRIGAFREVVAVAAGERIAVHARHDGTGDLVIEPAAEGTYLLAPEGDAAESERVEFPFLTAGVYTVLYRGNVMKQFEQTGPVPTPIGEVEVRAGETAVFPHDAREGSLVVEVDVSLLDGAAVAVTLWDADRAVAGVAGAERDGVRTFLFARVPVGSYVVRMDAQGRVSEASVEIPACRSEYRYRLEPAR